MSIVLFSVDDDRMIMSDLDIHPDTSIKIDKREYVWFDSSEDDTSFSFSVWCHHDDVFCGGDRKVSSESDWFPVIDSLERDIFSFSHIFIAKPCKGIEMLIYRAFPDITSTRVGDFESTKSREKSGEEEDTDTDLFDFFSVHMLDGYLRVVEKEGVPIPGHSHSEWLDDREKCENITDLWDIVESEVIEK